MAHEAPAAPPTEGAEPPSAPKSKMPLIAAIVAGIAVGAGSGVMVVGPMFAKKFAAQAVAVAADTTGSEGGAADGGKPAEGGAEHAEGGKSPAAAAPPVLTLENLVLNPSGTNGARYLLMTVALECKDQKGVEALTLRDPELRDVILTALGRKSVEELSDISHRDAIKAELLASLNERFGKAVVKQLYFPQFVIQ